MLRAKTDLVTPNKTLTVKARAHSVMRQLAENVEQPTIFYKRAMIRDRKRMTEILDTEGKMNGFGEELDFSFNKDSTAPTGRFSYAS